MNKTQWIQRKADSLGLHVLVTHNSQTHAYRIRDLDCGAVIEFKKFSDAIRFIEELAEWMDEK